MCNQIQKCKFLHWTPPPSEISRCWNIENIQQLLAQIRIGFGEQTRILTQIVTNAEKEIKKLLGSNTKLKVSLKYFSKRVRFPQKQNQTGWGTRKFFSKYLDFRISGNPKIKCRNLDTLNMRPLHDLGFRTFFVP